MRFMLPIKASKESEAGAPSKELELDWRATR
jgi:hypothetical protein